MSIFKSKSAARNERRRAASMEYDLQREAEGERQREAIDLHKAFHSQVIDALVAVGVDPDELIAFIRGYPE